MRFFKCLLAGAALINLASLCRANQIQIQLDNIAGQSQTSGSVNDPFGGASDTGKIAISDDPTNNPVKSSLGAVRFNNVPQTLVSPPSYTLSGTLNLTSGTVTGGSVLLDMNTGADVSFNITGGSVTNIGGGDFLVAGALSDLQFTSSSFAGLNVTPYQSAQPLPGTFEFIYDPNPTSGRDPNIQTFTITATVPEPSSVMAIGGVGTLLLGRRRLRSQTI
jgi:hypothetical protein